MPAALEVVWHRPPTKGAEQAQVGLCSDADLEDGMVPSDY